MKLSRKAFFQTVTAGFAGLFSVKAVKAQPTKEMELAYENDAALAMADKWRERYLEVLEILRYLHAHSEFNSADVDVQARIQRYGDLYCKSFDECIRADCEAAFACKLPERSEIPREYFERVTERLIAKRDAKAAQRPLAVVAHPGYQWIVPCDF